jgi:hypothetical protein
VAGRAERLTEAGLTRDRLPGRGHLPVRRRRRPGVPPQPGSTQTAPGKSWPALEVDHLGRDRGSRRERRTPSLPLRQHPGSARGSGRGDRASTDRGGPAAPVCPDPVHGELHPGRGGVHPRLRPCPLGKNPAERLPEITAFAEWIHDWAGRPNDWNSNRIGDPFYGAFISTGLWPPPELNAVPRTIVDDDKARHFYDQLACVLQTRVNCSVNNPAATPSVRRSANEATYPATRRLSMSQRGEDTSVIGG